MARLRHLPFVKAVLVGNGPLHACALATELGTVTDTGRLAIEKGEDRLELRLRPETVPP